MKNLSMTLRARAREHEMFTKSQAIEEKALRYLEERKVKATDIIKVLREQFEMPSGQAHDVARRSRQGDTGKHFLDNGGWP